MKCMVCGGSMKKARGNLAYASLPTITLVNVEMHRCTKCDEVEVAIPRIEALNQTIAGELVRKDGPLAHAEIRFLRKLLGWSGVDFAKHFGVTPETVSRWESGKKTMGPVAERLLRLCIATQTAIEDYGVEDLHNVDHVPSNTTLSLTTTARGWKAVAA